MIDNTNTLLSGLSSSLSGGGGPGSPQGVVPSNAQTFANALAGAAGMYLQYKDIDARVQVAKLENRTLALAAQLQGLNSEGYPGAPWGQPWHQVQPATGGLLGGNLDLLLAFGFVAYLAAS